MGVAIKGQHRKSVLCCMYSISASYQFSHPVVISLYSFARCNTEEKIKGKKEGIVRK